MNEQEQMSQLSALFDNELPPAQAELVIRRALKDPALRASWGRYALIGACVRNEPIQRAEAPDVAERVRLLLAAESEHPQHSAPVLVSYPGPRRGWALFGRGALGGAIAAGVAMLSLFVLHSMGPAAGPAVQTAQVTVPAAVVTVPQPVVVAKPQVVEPRTLVATNDSAPDSYTTPVDNSTQRISGPLMNLVVAHSEVAASAMRIIPLSSAMNGNYDIAQDAVEMTEAEIRVYR